MPSTEIINAAANVIAMVTALIGAVSIWMKAEQARIAATEAAMTTKETHLMINSRMDEMLALARSGAFAEGTLAGVTQEKNRKKDTPE